MKKLISALVFASLAVFSSHAQGARVSRLAFAGGAVHAHCTWVKGPQLPEESLLTIAWKNGQDHSAIEVPGSFKVALFMPGMGHGSSPTQIEGVVDEQGRAVLGAYSVRGIYFTMPGEWLVNVTLKTTDGKEETKAMRVNL